MSGKKSKLSMYSSIVQKLSGGMQLDLVSNPKQSSRKNKIQQCRNKNLQKIQQAQRLLREEKPNLKRIEILIKQIADLDSLEFNLALQKENSQYDFEEEEQTEMVKVKRKNQYSQLSVNGDEESERCKSQLCQKTDQKYSRKSISIEALKGFEFQQKFNKKEQKEKKDSRLQKSSRESTILEHQSSDTKCLQGCDFICRLF